MHGAVAPARYRLTTIVGMHPENQCCDGCRFCQTDTANRDRKRCSVTGEILWNPKQFGLWCPLEKEESEDESEFQGPAGG